ncbi:MAG: aspartate/glutamate racemase family protein [Paracoccus sp. (in: a-proteobacteria)]|uniref:aspartate/glutamate racemase family protein n=1 Tax=Paracoccus sp. TaxID=267 RepID=UPI00391AED0A
MRLLVINPNSNPAITAQIRDLADRVLGEGAEAEVTGLPAAPFAIQSPADRAIAEPLAIARIEAGVAQGFDAAVLACFDDMAISARGRLPIPIIDAVDASLTLARTCARRFAIVTTFDAAVPRIRTLISRHGLGRVCTVRAAGIGVSATAQLAPRTLARLRDAVGAAIRDDGAEAVILGSGALAGRAPVLARGFNVPVFDSIEAAIRLAAISASISRQCRSSLSGLPV